MIKLIAQPIRSETITAPNLLVSLTRWKECLICCLATDEDKTENISEFLHALPRNHQFTLSRIVVPSSFRMFESSRDWLLSLTPSSVIDRVKERGDLTKMNKMKKIWKQTYVTTQMIIKVGKRMKNAIQLQARWIIFTRSAWVMVS